MIEFRVCVCKFFLNSLRPIPLFLFSFCSLLTYNRHSIIVHMSLLYRVIHIYVLSIFLLSGYYLILFGARTDMVLNMEGSISHWPIKSSKLDYSLLSLNPILLDLFEHDLGCMVQNRLAYWSMISYDMIFLHIKVISGLWNS